MGQKTRVVLSVLMSTMRGLLRLWPSGCQGDSMGVPLLSFCPGYSDPSIACADRGDIVKFPSLQAHFNPLAREH